jgi:hypothetical protein
VFAAFLAGATLAADHDPHAAGAKAAAPAVRPEAVPAPGAAQKLSRELLQALVDTAASVGAKPAEELQRRMSEIPLELDADAQDPVRKLAADAKRAVLEAFAQARDGRRATEPRTPPAKSDAGREPGIAFDAASIALAASILSLVISMAALLVQRSAARRALRDAGLL